MLGVVVRLRDAHGEIDRGVIGHFEPKDLRRADQQRRFGARRFDRRAASLQKQRQQMPQRAEPAQHGCDQPARQSAVAIFEHRQTGMAFELFIERAAAAQHALDDFRRNPARGEARGSRKRSVLERLIREQSHE